MTGVLAVSGPSAYWYASRGTGVVALLLLTAGVALGLLGPLGAGSERLPRFVLSGLHRATTLLAVAFVAGHVVATVADGFAPIGLRDAVVPFASPYRPVWLGLGAVAFDLVLALVATSLLRSRLGLRAWRLVHWLAYAAWPVAVLHGLGTGTDAKAGWFQLLTAGCVGLVGGLLGWRLASARVASNLRLLAAGTATALVVGGAAWYLHGPLRPDWARRAGTPARLLAAPAPARGRIVGQQPALPALPFTARLVGRFAQAGPDGRGLVSVAVSAITEGARQTQLRLDLWGAPLPGGGIALRASSATFGPAGAARAYTGQVVGLADSRVLVGLRDASGRPLELTLDLRLDQAHGSVGGSLRAAAAGSGGDDAEGDGA